MPYSYSKSSLEKLATVHPDLQEIFMEVIKYTDVTIINGYRDKTLQNSLYRSRISPYQFPESKHNKQPSLAIDAAPYPIDWDDLNRFYYLAGFVFAIAAIRGIKIRWGGTFKKFDGPHFELIEEEE